MKKRFLALMSAGLGTALLLTACGHIGNITPDSKVKLNPNKPVSLTVWHYYNGAQQAAFDQLISEFNATEGKEKGIYVEGYTQGSVGDLEKAVSDAVAGAVGAQSLPDIFSTYADTAYAVQKEGKLAGVTEPEAKRKIIGEEFIRIFEEEAKKIGAVDFLAQGTIYPDVVESGLGGESGVIKSHHNVGGLPEHVDFKDIIEPLRDLFKDEVRKAGLELGIPERLVFRQPFPGPGLGIRIIGEVTEEKVKIVQDADAIYREEIANAGLDKNINQYFAALTNMRSVGVMGDERTYDYAVALRAVTTVDFMTAEAAEIPYDVLNKVMSRIINEVKGVNRVFYDLTSKPPGTIEFE